MDVAPAPGEGKWGCCGSGGLRGAASEAAGAAAPRAAALALWAQAPSCMMTDPSVPPSFPLVVEEASNGCSCACNEVGGSTLVLA